MKLTLNVFLSLDGVMQGPGGPDEDRSGGFDQGGWVVPFVDEEFGAIVDAWFAQTDEILFGRTTYDMMHAFWSQITDPDDVVATVLNTRPKHVVSTTLRDPGWQNSSVIARDVPAAVERLKAKPGGELQVHGSCTLAHTLHDAGLIDEYRLIIFPVVVGRGKRLFRDGSAPGSLTLVRSTTTSSGAVALTLQPAGSLGHGDIEVIDGKEVIHPA
ncbi:dihydrofolate reductase family protein [Pengzhenrongella frigida]|uniref:Dihydrofolate reductase n=1 Tax=Pengzhenrongella frigida TaxID=1259133 RepID=A0A4Q5MWD6_9MICO|nr:dihydrofolate reductase family protein [Cellulomonas sp. HLT2-17]RYV49898.1 dihydrofolate reductase [Cellulomonas sp. HLT2-17]